VDLLALGAELQLNKAPAEAHRVPDPDSDRIDALANTIRIDLQTIGIAAFRAGDRLSGVVHLLHWP